MAANQTGGAGSSSPLQHSPESWRRIKELFGALAEEGLEERERRLAEEAQKDPGIAAEVRSLLEVQGRGEALVSRLVEEEARGLMSGALHPLAPGTRLGAYEIVGHLGTGGMGAVFLARRADSEYESRVAIKLVRPGLFSDESLQRFRTERQTLATLNHPNIARLLDGGRTPEGLPYLVMEYVEGEPLDAFCAKRNLSLEERLRLFRVVCEAVSHAHRNLVVHRDIKPGNILVSQSGEVKLLDFGIAKLLGNDGETAGLTRTGERVLTPDYASPEQVRGGQVTTGSDVYSLGVLLYRLLTGQPPYRLPPDQPSEAERIVCEQIPGKPSTAVARAPSDSEASAPLRLERLAKRLRGDLDNIVLKALRKEPERRYGTVDEMSEDLRRHSEGLPVSARPETLSYLTGRFFLRHRLAAAAVVLVLASLTVGIFATTRQARRAERERAKAERIRDFLTGMLSAADANWYSAAKAAGPNVTVAQVLDEASARVRQEFSADPEMEGTLRRTLGTTYLALGRLDAAEREISRAVALYRRLKGEKSRESVESENVLASLFLAKGDIRRAEDLFRSILERARALSPSADLTLASAMNGLGLISMFHGDSRKAEAFFKEAVSVLSRLHGEKHASVAIALGNLALARDIRGDLDGAEAGYREALAVFDAVQGRAITDQGFTLLNLGIVLRVRGRLAEAEKLIRQSLVVWNATVGPEHPNTANSHLHLAHVLHLLGRSGAAEAEVEKALAIQRRKLPPGHADTAKSRTVLGLIFSDTGRHSQAEAVLRQALSLRQRVLPAGHWRIGETAGVLGACLLAQGRRREAEPLLRDSHRILSEKMGDENPRTQEAAQRLLLLDRERKSPASR